MVKCTKVFFVEIAMLGTFHIKRIPCKEVQHNETDFQTECQQT